jgi:hypothetical protein
MWNIRARMPRTCRNCLFTSMFRFMLAAMFRSVRIYLLAAGWLAVHAAGACLVAGEFKPRYSTVVAGIEYAHIQTPRPWSIHVARIERDKPGLTLKTTLARGTIVGLSPVSRQVAALPASAGQPVVAINGDFYGGSGAPNGLHIVDGKLIRPPRRDSFWMDSRGSFFIDTISGRFAVSWPNSSKLPFDLNRPRANETVVLYTSAYAASTRTKNGVEVVFDSPAPLSPGREIEMTVRELRDAPNSPLERGTAVLSFSPESGAPAVEPGAVAQFSTAFTPDLSDARIAVGGWPILVRDGKVVSRTSPRHPRTAVGFNERHLFFVVVDGRQKELSVGMNL